MEDCSKQPEQGTENSGKPGTSKKTQKIRIWLSIILIFLLFFILAIVALLIPLYMSYRDSYMHIDIITREDEYSRPDLPTDIIIESDSFAEGEVPPETDGDGNDGLVTDSSDDTCGHADGQSDTDDMPSVSEPQEEDPPEDHIVIENGIYYVKQKDPEIENFLVIGTDARNIKAEYGRSDSMIVASLNRRTGDIKLVSLLRDIYVPIEGHKWNRLNTAYAYGGVSLCVNTINDLFGLDIQKFVVVNLNGTKSFVDSCGGIDLSLSDRELDYLKNYTKDTVIDNGDGTYHLDGAAALSYMRIRKLDSDFKRAERQRKAIMALYSQTVANNDLSEIYDMVREGFDLVKTNIKLNDLLDIAKYLVSSLGSNPTIISDRIPYGKNGGSWNYARTPGGKSVIAIDFDKNEEYMQKLIYG